MFWGRNCVRVDMPACAENDDGEMLLYASQCLLKVDKNGFVFGASVGHAGGDRIIDIAVVCATRGILHY